MRTLCALLLLLIPAVTAAAELLGPFTSNVVNGPERGQQHCYVCDLGTRPAVLLLTRHLDPPLRKLLTGLQTMRKTYQSRHLFCWIVYVEESEQAEEAAEKFSQPAASFEIPMSVFDDASGPPGYGMQPSDSAIVLLSHGRKIVARRTYSDQAWSVAAADELLRSIPKQLGF